MVRAVRWLAAGVATVALAAPLVLAGAASASTTRPAATAYCCTDVGHALHVWHVAHVEHMAYMASLGY